MRRMNSSATCVSYYRSSGKETVKPIDIAPADLETVRCILREHVPELEVHAFGSRVSWTARETSDLDVALLTEEPLSIARVTNLKAAFTKSYLPFRVDIVDWAGASENFRKVIESEHVVLVEQKVERDYEEWRTLPLGKCANLSRDNVSPSESKDAIYIGLEHIGENTLSLVGYGSANDVKSSKTRFQNGDILFGKLRPYFRKVVLVNFDGICSTDIWVIRASEGIHQRFLYYNIASQSLVDFATLTSEGTRMPRAKWDYLSEYELQIPTYSHQCAIANILGTLDDKIELNRRMNKTLEEMAQALFKSWFVDFEPVKAKLAVLDKGGTADEAERAAMCAISGKDEFALSKLEREQPEAFSNLAQTASQFPSAMQNSELGEIPKGWEIVPFQSTVNFKEGPGIRNWQYTNSDQGTHFINIRCIQNGDLDLRTANRITDQEANGRYSHFHLQEWDIVVSTSGTLGRSAIVRKEHLPLLLNTSVIRFRPKQFRILFGYLYGYLNSNEFMTKLESMASGSVQKNFGPMHLNQLSILRPTINCIEHYEKTTLPLFRLLIENRRVNETLANLRNILLPKLISGQYRVASSTLKKWLDRKR